MGVMSEIHEMMDGNIDEIIIYLMNKNLSLHDATRLAKKWERELNSQIVHSKVQEGGNDHSPYPIRGV